MPTDQTEIVAVQDLSATDLARWDGLRSGVPALEPAFLSSAFAVHVGAVRRDARVAVLRGGGSQEPMGFLPFHTSPTRLGRPIGRKLADAQGAVVHPDLSWDPRAVVRRSGLRALSFDHLVGDQDAFAPYVRQTGSSPRLDVSGGFEAYVAAARDEGRGGPGQAARKARRLDRTSGMRFTWNNRDASALRTLLAWKSAQYQRSGAVDQMQLPWVVDLLERLHASEDPHCTGILSTLHAGDDLVAAHFGLRSERHLAWWFPSYDPAWSKHSPGSVLLLETARAAAGAGMATVDLGKGYESYKDDWATGSVPLHTAVVPGNAVGAGVTAAGRLAWGLARRSPMHARAGRLQWRLDVG